MVNRFKHTCVICFLVLSGVLLSQNEATKWYFGNTAGLDFMTSPPTVIANGVMGAYEGCSSIADASGNVLMYSNGLVLLNRLNQVMANGSGLAGVVSSAQSCLIIKQPGNPNLYYIFTTRAYETSTHNLSYSIADMNLSAGNGSVTVKNMSLFANSSEKLTAVRHCNGTDFWVISHDRLLSSFRAYPFTAAGIGSPVISTANPVDMGSGYLKASPSGRKLAMTNYDTTSTGPAGPFSFALYDFDNSTGIVSNALDLGAYPLAYGCEFSPDETKLYGSNLTALHQWDLCAGSGPAIVASHYQVNALSPHDSISLIASLQRAPDGKIYAARWLQQALGVINNPNLAGSSCNYVDTSQTIAPKTASGGLPNFMPLFKPVLPSFTATVNSAVSCNTASFNATPLISCPYSGFISSLAWNFDDPGSGSANASTLSTVTHTYTTPGVYTVKLVLYSSCGGVIDTLKQQVSILHIPISAASGFSLCAGKTLTLSAAGGFSNYQWSNGSTTNETAVTPGMTTTYTLTATDAFGCSYRSVQTVTVSPQPPVAIAGKTLACPGSVLTQTASGATHYSWSNGDTTSVISITPTAGMAYTVTGTNAKGCTATATTSIGLVEIPALTVNGATICSGNTGTLQVVATNTAQTILYTWAPGNLTGPGAVVSGTATQVYTVTASISSCSTTTYGTLTVITPSLSTSPSLTITPGSSVTLQASGGDSYHWDPPDYLGCADCSSPVASPPDDRVYCVTSALGSCTATACVTIAVSCIVNGDFSLPNAFTPNGDNNNDAFCLRGWECTNNFNIKIFDRWGEKVFESGDPAFCWDGVYNGMPLTAAVFVYVVSATKKNNDLISKKGNITLLR